MIVYQSTKQGFLKDASSGIEDIVRECVRKKLSIDVKPGSSEYDSWRNSLGNAMHHVLNTDKIPDDSGVAIEYSIPRSKNRIDFLITGEDGATENGGHHRVKAMDRYSVTDGMQLYWRVSNKGQAKSCILRTKRGLQPFSMV